VYAATWFQTKVAVKYLTKEGGEAEKEFLNEIKVMAELPPKHSDLLLRLHGTAPGAPPPARCPPADTVPTWHRHRERHREATGAVRGLAQSRWCPTWANIGHG